MPTTRTTIRTHWVALRALLALTVVLGLAYPLVVTVIGQVTLPAQTNGSIVQSADGEIIGSALVGQSFTDASGEPLTEWFQSRPSVAGDGYDGGASGGSNLGPENEDLITAIQERKAGVAALEGVAEPDVPADAVTASASGLDPHVSPEYALLQVDRVARERGLDEADVRALVEDHIQAPDLGFLGSPTVNVLSLNLALAEMGD
jgi:K+-transporting ATPase ATPase C chain